MSGRDGMDVLAEGQISAQLALIEVINNLLCRTSSRSPIFSLNYTRLDRSKVNIFVEGFCVYENIHFASLTAFWWASLLLL